MSPSETRAYYSGVRASITWLHQRAASMNDPHARAILNSAGFDLGVDKPDPATPALPAPKTAIKADPASVLPVLAHLVQTGQATQKQRQELAHFLSPATGAAREAVAALGFSAPFRAEVFPDDDVTLDDAQGKHIVWFNRCTNLPLSDKVGLEAERDQWLAFATFIANVANVALTSSETLSAPTTGTAPEAMTDMFAALTLAEDVLSRFPFTSEIWPNGTHPNTGMEQIRAALRGAAPPTEAT